MNQVKITKLEQIISKDYSNTTGIVVCKNGTSVYEQYFQDNHNMSRFHVFSVTKGILSILFGIALDQGYLKSVQQQVLDFFPDYQMKQGEKVLQRITIQDLLTMTVPYKYPSDNYMGYFMSDDRVKFSLDELGGEGTIGAFQYVPFAVTDVLSGILTKVTGKSLFDFATEHLFTPLGMTVASKVVLHSAEEQMQFNTATDISGWVVDQKGMNPGGWGLTLSTLDMAKIGQLCLNGGAWEGRQIVSLEWLKESTREHSRWEEMQILYGYLWWIIDPEEGACAAMGDGGNIIYFNKKKELVIAISSMFTPDAKDRIGLVKEYIEPIFEEE